jgi:(S)-ureidoglycine aminohydrolase
MNPTSPLFGHTRTVVASRHALIAPDGHVPSAFPEWLDATAYVMISPAMGADFSQIRIVYPSGGGEAMFPPDEHEHVTYVVAGTAWAEWDDNTHEMQTGAFLFTPPGTPLRLRGNELTVLTVFRKIHEPQPGFGPPPLTFGNANDVPGEPFLGNEKALLKVLLPPDPRFDMAVNIFTYQPGATLPFVETHIMEHGLLMLSGQGVYRLENAYYPVTAGDVIWMAPYCPQWFVAMGDEPASYLYYKDINRLP